jgi:type I restriction enzyme S subunit
MVEWKKLGEVCSVFDGTHQTPKYTESGVKFVSVENIDNLYFTNKYISKMAYSENYKIKPQKGDVLMTRIGDVGRCAIITKDEPIAFYVSLALLRPNPEFILCNYLKHIIESKTGRIELRKRTLLTAVPLKINLGEIGKIRIPIPSLEEQNRIVGILDTFTDSIENLKQQIAQRRKQYEYYRDQLLDLEGKEGVEMKTLGKICYNLDFKRKPITGSKRVAGIYPYYGASGIVDYVESYIFDGEYLLVSEDGANLLTRTTPIAFSIKGKNWVNNHAHVLEFDNKTTQKFVEIFLNMIDLSPWINGAAQPKLNQANLNIIEIPLPPLPEQQRIVSILDTFEASISNLEAQLAQRQKQYEYYRNQLLTFE